jgi:hypothetical protein
MKKFMIMRPLARILNGRISTVYATRRPDQASAYATVKIQIIAMTPLAAALLF